jgi:hypothetical protein
MERDKGITRPPFPRGVAQNIVLRDHRSFPINQVEKHPQLVPGGGADPPEERYRQRGLFLRLVYRANGCPLKP